MSPSASSLGLASSLLEGVALNRRRPTAPQRRLYGGPCRRRRRRRRSHRLKDQNT